MPSPIEPGLSVTRHHVVTEEDCVARADAWIYSTPSVVRLVEESAIQLLDDHLANVQESVGTKLNVAHVAPTFLGQSVRATVTVTEVDRRRIVFGVAVEDAVEVIATGTHERFVLDSEKFGAQLEHKRAQL